MRIVLIALASKKYWKEEELYNIYQEIQKHVGNLVNEYHLVCGKEEIRQIEKGDCAVLVPLSGSVQPLILEIARQFDALALYAAYIRGNLRDELAETLLRNNAAPAIMDSWAVLREDHPHVEICLNRRELANNIKILAGWKRIQSSTLLLVGDREPWVISNGSVEDYEKIGVTIKRVKQSEVVQIYEDTSNEEAREIYEYFVSGAESVVEPKEEDIWASARMAKALIELLEKYKADGMALACFNLLKEGTNGCLGVSYINDCTNYIAACEGDLDSAVTMFAMKQLTGVKPWMANPGLHPNGVVNFSHCTAPLNMKGEGKCPYILRNHHESGIGTSIQAKYPEGETVTICRISGKRTAATVQKGITVAGKYESTCRTQVYIKMEDFDRYLSTVLGCHQVFVFEDIIEPMKKLCRHLGLKLQ